MRRFDIQLCLIAHRNRTRMSDSARQPYHILMVEDDPGVARSLNDGLSREGFAVTWKPTGTEAISFAQDHSPHLILLDVRLPDGSGFDVCRQMRQLGLRQPIMMLTVQDDEIDKILGL